MSESIRHKCALAGVRSAPDSTLNTSSVAQALTWQQWNRGGAGWGFRGSMEGALSAQAGGTERSALCEMPRQRREYETPVTTAIGHGRYVTSGEKPQTPEDEERHRQPFTFEAAGLQWAFAFNGNIANYGQLREGLAIGEPNVDTEAIRCILREEIDARAELIGTDIRRAMTEVFDALERRLDGAFNIVLMNNRDELFAYRDRHGFRPLVSTDTEEGSTIVASESSALDKVLAEISHGATVHIEAGQLLVSDAKGVTLHRVRDPELSRCFFEWVYFARDLSAIDGVSVAEVRKALGRKLAALEGKVTNPDAICIGVPKSALTVGNAFGGEAIPYVEGALIRKPFAGRSFKQGTEEERERVAREKFELHPEKLRGKDVYLVEDSVVRGTTMRVLAQMLREAGVRSIHLRVACPAIVSACFYGIDYPTIKELLLGKYRQEIIENGGALTPAMEAEIAQILGVDSVKFLPQEAMLEAFEECGIDRKTLCTACIDGRYPTAAGRDNVRQLITEEELLRGSHGGAGGGGE